MLSQITNKIFSTSYCSTLKTSSKKLLESKDFLKKWTKEKYIRNSWKPFTRRLPGLQEFSFVRTFLPYKRFCIFRFWNVFSLQDRDADGFSIFKSKIMYNCLIYFTYLLENLVETAAFYTANQDESSYWSTEKLINHLIVDSHISEWQAEPS